MNKYIYSAAAFLSLSCIALTSCQNEMEQIGAPAGKEVLLRVTANRGDAETRTALEHDGGDLTCNWSVGDQLMVVGQSTGKKIGVVTLVSGEDDPNAVFEGIVDLSDNTNVSLVYLGTAENAENYSESLNYLSLNLSEQNGTLASLSDKDVLTSSTFVVDNTYSSKEVEIADVTMTRQLAFGRFSLDFGEENVTLEAGDVITITGEGLRSEGKVNFRNGGSVPDNSASYSGPTSITITKTEGGNDFYVTMLPCGNVTPTFTVVKGGDTYTATLGAHNWVSGEYVRAYDAANSSESGVSVTMEKEAAIDHSKNPLAKWAESNLAYDKSSKTSDFVGSETASGSLYQWGRNVGFADYKDARGPLKTTSDSYNYYNYYVIGEDRDGETHAGMGCKMYSNGVYTIDAFRNVNTENFLTDDCRESFVMDGSFDDYTGDYYDEYFGEDGSTWSVRAKLCGYTATTPAPDKYRLPSSSDYNMILPKGKSFSSSSTSLSTDIDGYVEIRPIDETCSYVITWSISSTGLNICALVVSTDYSQTEADSLIWLTDENTVKRVFPFTGAIKADHRSGYVRGSGAVSGFTDYIAGPIPMLGTTTKQLSSYAGTKHVEALGYSFPATDYAKSCMGAYWTEDGKIFMFTDNQFYSGIDNNLVITSGAKHNAYGLRCILK